MLCLIAICGLLSHALARRLKSKPLGLAAFTALMLAMWCDTLYQQLLLKPQLCAGQEGGVKINSTVQLPPEYYRADGGGSDLFSKEFSFGETDNPPKVMLLGRYYIATNYIKDGESSFTRHSQIQRGLWDYKEKRWVVSVTHIYLKGGNWWATPITSLFETTWASSRLAKSSTDDCGLRLTDTHIYSALGIR